MSEDAQWRNAAIANAETFAKEKTCLEAENAALRKAIAEVVDKSSKTIPSAGADDTTFALTIFLKGVVFGISLSGAVVCVIVLLR